MNDKWLNDCILYAPPPTSEGYNAPIVAYDEPERASPPIDALEGQITENLVVIIGTEPGGFDSYRVLVHWYTRLIQFLTDDSLANSHCIKRLSKHMKCSYPGAERMLDDARKRYELKRFTYKP